MPARSRKRPDRPQKSRKLNPPTSPRMARINAEVGSGGVSETMGTEVETMLACLSPDNTVEARSAAARFFRRLLAKSSSITQPTSPKPAVRIAPIHVPVLVNALVDCLPMEHNTPEIQMDATWALTNILCGDGADTHLVVAAGAPDHLIRLTRQFYSRELRDQAVWALANIAGDCDNCRNVLFNLHFVPVLQDLIVAHKSDKAPPSGIYTLQTAVWALSNMCRGFLSPPFIMSLAPILGVLVEVLGMAEVDPEVAADATWCLSYVADGGVMGATMVLESGAVATLVNLLRDAESDSGATRGSVRMLGNLLTGGDAETQAVIEAGAISAFHQLLLRKGLEEGLVREVVWCLSNIAAGTAGQVEALLSVEGLVEVVLDRCRMEEGKVGREAAWTLSNAVTGGSTAHVRDLVAAGAVAALARCFCLDQDNRLLGALVGTFRVLLEGAAGDAPVVHRLLRSARVPAVLGKLRRHTKRSLRLCAHHLLRQHFNRPPASLIPSNIPSPILTVNCP